MKKLSSLFLALFFLVTIATGQGLSPQELITIKQFKQLDEIIPKLAEKGYNTIGVNEEAGPNLTQSGWYFDNKPGEDFIFYVHRLENKTGKSEVRYWIRNVYQYKEFIDNLAKEKYSLKGATVIAGKNFTVLTRKNISFLVAEQQDVNDKTYYEVIVLDSSVPSTELLSYSE